MVFFIFAKMLVLLGLNVETNGKFEVSDKFFLARKTSMEFSLTFLIPAYIILLGCLGLFLTVNLAVLILGFPDKQVHVFQKCFGWSLICWFEIKFMQISLPCFFVGIFRKKR